MYDAIDRVGYSLIQHGKSNNRIYLMKLDKRDKDTIVPKLEKLAEVNNYGKIFAKVPVWACYVFQYYNFFKEAFVPNMYNGRTGSYFMSKYTDESRKNIILAQRNEIDDIRQLAITKGRQYENPDATSPFPIRILEKADVPQLVELYKTAFTKYPYPIIDENYLSKSMKNNTAYYGAFDGERLVAAASAETDAENSNVEMSDFVTHTEYQGKNLSLFILMTMEADNKKQGIMTTYTLTRSLSAAINITFAKNSYHYAGLLRNNTNINGQIESMNVWYKKLHK